MHWSLFAVIPVILATALGALPRLRLRVWLFSIALVAFVEILAIGNPAPNWEHRHAVALWILGVLAPWVISALFLVLAKYPRRHLLVAMSFLIVYFVSLFVCLAIGDGLGLIPQ